MITKSYSTNNRAPKLRSLKNQAVFSETIGSVGIVDADLSPQVRPKVWLIYKYFWVCSSLNQFELISLPSWNRFNKGDIFWEVQLNLTKSPKFIWNYLVLSNKVWRFCHIFVAFSQYINIELLLSKYLSDNFECYCYHKILSCRLFHFVANFQTV